LYTFGKGDLSSGVQGVDFGCTKCSEGRSALIFNKRERV